MITIANIAKAAKVSTTTVSNVINGKTHRVSEATIDRVNRIIAETGYVPNMSARALASRASKVVALIHYSCAHSDKSFDDPFISRLTGAVEQALRKSGYYLMLRTVSNAAELNFFLRNWSVDGLFLTGVFEGDEIHAALTGIDKPIVLCDSYLSDYGHMANIGLQDAEGGRLAAGRLLKAGHRRIAFCSPPFRLGGVVDKRLTGFRQILADAGVDFDESLMFVSEFSAPEACKLGAEISRRGDITAIFATADILAAGIMAGIREAGKRVPDDYSIVGFDNLNWCRLTAPTLTTVCQNTGQKGRMAADMMVSMLENGPKTQVKERNIQLPVRLVERESVQSAAHS